MANDAIQKSPDWLRSPHTVGTLSIAIVLAVRSIGSTLNTTFASVATAIK
jgi:hypothetical protein